MPVHLQYFQKTGAFLARKFQAKGRNRLNLRRLRSLLSGLLDSNQRPRAPQTCALPTALSPDPFASTGGSPVLRVQRYNVFLKPPNILASFFPTNAFSSYFSSLTVVFSLPTVRFPSPLFRFLSSSRQPILHSPVATLLHVEQSRASTIGSSVPPFVKMDASAAMMPSAASEMMEMRTNCMTTLPVGILPFGGRPRTAGMTW